MGYNRILICQAVILCHHCAKWTRHPRSVVSESECCVDRTSASDGGREATQATATGPPATWHLYKASSTLPAPFLSLHLTPCHQQLSQPGSSPDVERLHLELWNKPQPLCPRPGKYPLHSYLVSKAGIYIHSSCILVILNSILLAGGLQARKIVL